MAKGGYEIRREVRLHNGHYLVWRSARPEDAALVWKWWTAPRVSYWSIAPRLSKAGPAPHDEKTVRSYLELPASRRGADPLIGLIDGTTPAAYAELYTKRESAFAWSNLVEDDARGVHLLADPIDGCDRRIIFEISIDGVDWQFAEWQHAPQCVGDPDVRNRMMRNLCTRLGMRQVGIIELPYKTACLMAVSRSEWEHNRDRLRSRQA